MPISYGETAGTPGWSRKVRRSARSGEVIFQENDDCIVAILPEINALQSAMRKQSAGYIAEAERQGHSEDVCTYMLCVARPESRLCHRT